MRLAETYSKKLFNQSHCSMLVLFIHAVANTMIIPVLPAFMSNELAAGPEAASLFVLASVPSGLFLTLVAGHMSEKIIRPKHLLFTTLIWLSLGSILLSFVQTFEHAIYVGFLFICAFHIPSALLLSIIKSRSNRLRRLAEISSMRTSYILGSVAGPVLGGIMMSLELASRNIFLIQSLCYAIAGICAFVLLRPNTKIESFYNKNPADRSFFLELSHLPPSIKILFIAICCLLMGDTLRITTLPLLLEQKFDVAPWQIGITMSIVPSLEIPCMILILLCARRFSEFSIFFFGAICGFLFFVLMPIATSIWHLWLLLGLYSVLRVSVTTTGLSLMVEMQISRSNMAASLQFTAQQSAVLLGSLLTFALVKSFGLITPYYFFATICAFGLLCLLLISLKYKPVSRQ